VKYLGAVDVHDTSLSDIVVCQMCFAFCVSVGLCVLRVRNRKRRKPNDRSCGKHYNCIVDKGMKKRRVAKEITIVVIVAVVVIICVGA